MTLYNFLLEPFTYPFLVRALLTALIVGTVCAVLSCFIILKGWSLMGDAISHAVFPGIVLSYILKIPLSIGAFVAGISCSLLTGVIKEKSRLKEDTVMGVVFSGLFAFGLVLFSKVDSDQHLSHILFGNLLGISWKDIFQTFIIAFLVVMVIAVKYKDFLLYCFDPIQARALGISNGFLKYTLLALLSLTVVSALQAVGVILVIGLLIGPGGSAFLLSSRFSSMLKLSLLMSWSSCFLGVLLSYHFDVATGPLIILVQTGFFAFSLLKISAKKFFTSSLTVKS